MDGYRMSRRIRGRFGKASLEENSQHVIRDTNLCIPRVNVD